MTPQLVSSFISILIVEDSYSTSRTIDGRTFTLEITGTSNKVFDTDTAGQEEYRGLWQSSHLAKADAYLLVYDITSPPTLEQLADFDDLIISCTEELPDPIRKVKVIAGNKCDLASQRTVSSAEGLQWARTRGMGFMETSAKLKVNVEETFALIVRRVVEARKAAEEQPLHTSEKGTFEEIKHGGGEQEMKDSGCCRCCSIC
jgi:GTPase KRas